MRKNSLELFRRLDPALWEKCGHNPVKMLGQLSQDRMNLAETDKGLLAHLDRVSKRMDAYMTGSRWYETAAGSAHPEAVNGKIAE